VPTENSVKFGRAVLKYSSGHSNRQTDRSQYFAPPTGGGSNYVSIRGVCSRRPFALPVSVSSSRAPTERSHRLDSVVLVEENLTRRLRVTTPVIGHQLRRVCLRFTSYDGAQQPFVAVESGRPETQSNPHAAGRRFYAMA